MGLRKQYVPLTVPLPYSRIVKKISRIVKKSKGKTENLFPVAIRYRRTRIVNKIIAVEAICGFHIGLVAENK